MAPRSSCDTRRATGCWTEPSDGRGRAARQGPRAGESPSGPSGSLTPAVLLPARLATAARWPTPCRGEHVGCRRQDRTSPAGRRREGRVAYPGDKRRAACPSRCPGLHPRRGGLGRPISRRAGPFEACPGGSPPPGFSSPDAQVFGRCYPPILVHRRQIDSGPLYQNEVTDNPRKPA